MSLARREASGGLRGFELDRKEDPEGAALQEVRRKRLYARVEGLRNPGGHHRSVEFNDASYQPLSNRGGHGIVGFEYTGGGESVLPPVPGGTEETPAGTWIEKKNRATGAWTSPGYLPPCSGGRGNRYFAVVKAVDADKKVLAKAKIKLGRY